MEGRFERVRRLLDQPGAFVELEEGHHIAYLGRWGDAHLRAYVLTECEPYECGVEIAEDPGELAGIPLVARRVESLEAGQAWALERAWRLAKALEALAERGEA